MRIRSLQKTSLTTVLTLLFVLLVVLSVGFTNYLAFRNGQRAVNEIAVRLRSEMTARIEQHLKTYLETPHVINAVNTDALVLKQIDSRDFSSLEEQFVRQSVLFESVSYIYFASETSGDFVGVKKEQDGTLTVRLGSGTQLSVYAVDDQGKRAEMVTTHPYTDSRVRSWFREAAQHSNSVFGVRFQPG